VRAALAPAPPGLGYSAYDSKVDATASSGDDTAITTRDSVVDAQGEDAQRDSSGDDAEATYCLAYSSSVGPGTPSPSDGGGRKVGPCEPLSRPTFLDVPPLSPLAVSDEHSEVARHEQLFSSLLSTIAEPSFTLLLYQQISDDGGASCSAEQTNMAVQCNLVDQRDVARIKSLLDSVKEREDIIASLSALTTEVKVVADTADACCQTKRPLKLSVATQCCNTGALDADINVKTALKDAEDHIVVVQERYEHLRTLSESDYDDLTRQLSKERQHAARRTEEILSLKRKLARVEC
jgi:hypothetical protein